MDPDEVYSERQQLLDEFGTCLVQFVVCQIFDPSYLHFFPQEYRKGLGICPWLF
jgi:hypothetical protein